MLAFSKILTGAAGLAMVAGTATPAAAQYPYGYPGGGNVVGQIIGQVLGGGRYGAYGASNDRYAVDRCAQAAEARLNRTRYAYGSNSYYSRGYYNMGNGYNGAGSARVVGITRVERRANGGLKVYGVMSSGMGYGNRGYNNAYAYNNAAADLRFDCKIDYRGYVTDVDINRGSNIYYRR